MYVQPLYEARTADGKQGGRNVLDLCTTSDIITGYYFKNPYPHIGVSMRTPSLFYIGCKYPTTFRAGRINLLLEYFQAPHPSRANQPIIARAFTSDSIYLHWSLPSVRVKVRVTRFGSSGTCYI